MLAFLRMAEYRFDEEVFAHGERVLQDGLFVRAEGRENPFGDVVVRGTADADTQPPKIRRAETRFEGTKAVVSAQSAAPFERDRSRRQFNLVMDDKAPGRRDFVKRKKRRRRFA